MNKNNKAFFTVLLVLCLLCISSFVNIKHAYAVENFTYNVLVDGHLLNSYVPSMIVNETTAIVPIKPLCKSLDAEVKLNKDTESILVSKGNTTITIKIGSNIAKVNDKKVYLNVNVIEMFGSTMVPVRFIVENLGSSVTQNEKNKTIMVNSTQAKEKHSYTRQQLEWALATNAILTKMNNGNYNLIGMEEPNDYNIEKTKRSLVESWGINNREDALRKIKWLKESGHRKHYNYKVFFVSRASEEKYNSLLNKLDKKEAKELKFVKEHYKKIGDKGLIAWDYCRLVHIVGCCYKIGYLEYDEVVKEIMEAARIIQNSFSSWEEMSENYAWGRYLWGGKDCYEEVNIYREWLLLNKKSPWTKIDWELSLE